MCLITKKKKKRVRNPYTESKQFYIVYSKYWSTVRENDGICYKMIHNWSGQAV